MPTGFSNPTVFLPNGNPESYNEPTLRRAGDLGTKFIIDANRYQVVKLDSGATAATPAGAVIAGSVVYWKDRLNYLVTNDTRFSDALEADAAVAGILPAVVTAGNYTAVVKKKRNQNVKVTGATWNAGDYAVPNDSSPTGDAKRVAKGTAPTNLPVIGIVRGPLAGSLCPVDVDLPDVD